MLVPNQPSSAMGSWIPPCAGMTRLLLTVDYLWDMAECNQVVRRPVVPYVHVPVIPVSGLQVYRNRPGQQIPGTLLEEKTRRR